VAEGEINHFVAVGVGLEEGGNAEKEGEKKEDGEPGGEMGGAKESGKGI